MSCFKIELSMPSGTPFRRLFAITSAPAIQSRNGETDELCSFRRSKSRTEPGQRARIVQGSPSRPTVRAFNSSTDAELKLSAIEWSTEQRLNSPHAPGHECG